ncbi:Kinesin motor domain [Dillenia turbinata]|uniref:Kinesin-like protein n=1 Tax=Dillenia turbinata TaxID=194707 RepID=A0AAN8ZNV8_9MAGN
MTKIIARTPVTPPSKIPRMPSSTPGPSRVGEEKIFVTVRMRPLNRKEQEMYDLIAWDCVDDHTILLKTPNHECSTLQYTFDKVFGPTCCTQKVYEEGAKDVVLSALSGINATIFAYGQTSSGKTFTMRGITENAIKDIYEHMESVSKIHPRDFILKVSALEIYNETVLDLLNRESGPLRLLDDPQKGTTVEKLAEEVVKDSMHLRYLISICEAQRQVGETTLNDKSSRSHQIIRLIIESNLKEKSGHVKSFVASLNFVDLAGSERASQTNADGTRLKEGSHINRSLLTLTTVIRKLSDGKRNLHIPYRDSKLTRILQGSLGGNARTAIICTISPALSHVEHSRNTLSFATSAKEVVNSAQVNMVISEKQLVKHLQKEVARLEAELQSPEASYLCLRSLLLEKDLKIKEMEREMKELKRQRDFMQLQLDTKAPKEQKGLNESGPSHQIVKSLSFPDENDLLSGSPSPRIQAVKAAGRQAIVRWSATSNVSSLVCEIRKIDLQQRQLGEEANRALEVLHKEIDSCRLGSQDAARNIARLLSEIKEMQFVSCAPETVKSGDQTNLREEIIRLNSEGSNFSSLEKKLENVQESIDKLILSLTTNVEVLHSKSQAKKKKTLPFSMSNSPNMPTIIRSPCSPWSSSVKATEHERENKSPENDDPVSSCNTTPGQCNASPTKNKGDGSSISSREGTPYLQKTKSVNVRKLQKMFEHAAEENIRSIRAYVTELKERVAKLQYQKQLLVCQVLEMEAGEGSTNETEIVDQSPMSWPSIFSDQRKQIIMLWHLCHVSIVHRTQFYMLFRGDPSDQIYIEVELRRLTWLEHHLAELGNASPALLGDEPAGSVSSSIRALKQEREYLAKRMNSKLTTEEREALYAKWDIPPEGKQRRRLQLANKIWTDPYSMQHVHESAAIVAKLVGFCEPGEHVSKEMFELNFAPLSDKKMWMGWNLLSNLFRL